MNDGAIFDVDAHFIPANEKKGELPHWHYELRYLLVSPTEEMVVSDESDDLRWFSLEELEEELGEGKWEKSIERMVKKWRKFIDNFEGSDT